MLKIMIVDDESLLRMAVKSLLDWEANGFIMLPDASNGETALELIEREFPDILLTDIKMPVMDGVELIKQIERRFPQVKTIVLSNYDDFNYVKEALTHGAVDYILKANITPENLIKVINNLKEKFITDERITHESLKRENEVQKSFQFLKNEFLKNLINGDITSLGEIEEKNDYYDAGLRKGRFVVCAILADDVGKLTQKYQGEESTLLQNTIITIMNEILVVDKSFIVCNPYHFALILYTGSCTEVNIGSETFEILTRFQTAIFRYANISFTIGISGIKEKLSELSVAYHESVDAASYRFYLGKGKIYRHNEIKLTLEDPQVKWMNKSNLNCIADSFEKGNMDGITGILNDCFEDIAQRRYSIYAIKKFLTDFIVFLRSTFLEMMEEYEVDFIQSETVLKQVNQCESLSEVAELVFGHIQQIETYLKSDDVAKHSDIIGKALKIIRASYDKNISLNSVASDINVNPSYLSRLFLKETRKNFIDYLTEYRIKKAMGFLEEGKLRVHEVGEKIGYPNSKYFNRVFKKVTGVSPQQYRMGGGVSRTAEPLS